MADSAVWATGDVRIHVGDLVKGKDLGGPTMRVRDVVMADDGDVEYTCFWFAGDDYREVTISPAWLEVVKRAGA